MLRPSSRLIGWLTLAGFIFFTAAAAIAQSQTAPSKAPSKAAPHSKAAAKAPAKDVEPAQEPDPNTPEKEYTVTLVNGTKVKVTVFPSKGIPGKTIRFDPFVNKTDMNVYAIALNSMWQIFGKQTGSFKADAAVAAPREIVGGTVVLYKVTPKGRFAFFPLIDPEKKLMSAAMVWME